VTSCFYGSHYSYGYFIKLLAAVAGNLASHGLVLTTCDNHPPGAQPDGSSNCACARQSDVATNRDAHTSVFGGQPVDSNAWCRQSGVNLQTAHFQQASSHPTPVTVMAELLTPHSRTVSLIL
jgi:hypothetical protein